MDFASSATSYHESSLILPGDFMDTDIPLSSMGEFLQSPELEIDFTSIDWQVLDTFNSTPSTDSLSDSHAAGQVYEHINANFASQADATTKFDENRACQNIHGTCLSLATSVLGSLHTNNSGSCVLSIIGEERGRQHKRQPSRGADAILSLNQSALRTVRSILKCPSCSGRPQILLIVSVICSEISTLYCQLVDIYSQGQRPGSGRPMSNSSKIDIQRLGICIGSHRLGKDVEATLIRQVLMDMLKELQFALGDITRNPSPSPFADQQLRGETSESRVRARIGEFLDKQLASLKKALGQS